MRNLTVDEAWDLVQEINRLHYRRYLLKGKAADTEYINRRIEALQAKLGPM